MIRSANPRSLSTLALLTALFTGGCDDKSAAQDGSASAKSSASTSKSDTKTAPTASAAKAAEPASTLPEKGPWEAVKISYSKDDPKDGSPMFKMENLGGKTIKVCFMDFYGYDEAGKQVAHKDLSWNGDLKGGKTDESIYTTKVDGVKTWEATYHGIQFEGDKETTMNYKRAPGDRPKGG